MANTTIPIELSSTPGIVDNSNATAITIDSSENVGIGTTSPTVPLEVAGNIFINTSGNPNFTVKTSGAGNNPNIRIQADTNYWDLQTLFSNANNELDFRYNGSSKMIIDSSGNVGIGTSSPDARLHIVNNSSNNFASSLRLGQTYDTNVYSQIESNFGGSMTIKAGQGSGTASLNIQLNGSEKMRISSSGNLLVGTSYDGFNAKQVIYATGTNPQAKSLTVWNGGGSGCTYVQFVNSGGSAIGSITQTAGNTIQYNTSSDARLKNVTGSARGLEVINALNPVAFNWKEDGHADEGLLAQEVQEIVPNAVSGSEEEYYQMDYSKLVTHLVAGMKEQQTIIESLEARITALES